MSVFKPFLLVWTILAPTATWAAGTTGPSPATAPITASAPGEIKPLPSASNLGEGLAWTETEKTILQAVRDRTSALDEEGLYVALRRAYSLPPVQEEQWNALDRPAYGNLLNQPDRYRGLPLRMNVYISTVQRISTNNGLSASRWWPAGRAVWQIMALHADAEAPASEPLILYSTSKPDLPREPSEVDSRGRMVYSPPRKAEVAGLFYKVHAGHEIGTGEARMYPVLVCWQVGIRGGGPADGGLHALAAGALVLVLVVALGAATLMLMRRVRRLRRTGSDARRSNYRPLRDLSAQVQRTHVDENEAVDPALADAARAHRSRKHDTDDTNDPG